MIEGMAGDADDRDVERPERSSTEPEHSLVRIDGPG
jgi:hypothetical protein